MNDEAESNSASEKRKLCDTNIYSFFSKVPKQPKVTQTIDAASEPDCDAATSSVDGAPSSVASDSATACITDDQLDASEGGAATSAGVERADPNYICPSPDDIGLYVQRNVKLSDDQRLRLLRHAWAPPSTYQLPYKEKLVKGRPVKCRLNHQHLSDNPCLSFATELAGKHVGCQCLRDCEFLRRRA